MRCSYRVAVMVIALLAALGPGFAFAVEPPVAAALETSPAPHPVTLLQDDDLAVTFSGAWMSRGGAGASGGSARLSSRAGAWAAASFEGTGVAIVAPVGPASGKARVTVDGLQVAVLDLYAPSVGAAQAVWRSAELSAGVHTVSVTVLGQKSPLSTGTGVGIDAFEVTGTALPRALVGTLVNNGHSKLVAQGSWVRSIRAEAYGGSAWRTGSAKRSATVRFKGTGLTLVGRKDPSGGRAEILVDGKRVAIVSFYSPTIQERRVVWSDTGMRYGVHNVVVRSLGTPGVAGGGTYVDVDAFLVNGALLQAYRPTPFSYPWRTYIVVDKSDFKLYWVRNGLLIKTYPIAHGKIGWSTPARTWRIDAKYYTSPGSVYGPRKMRMFKQVRGSRGYRYIHTAYAIHGTNQPWVIGTRASHGCIRMYNRDVLELFPQVPMGTMVITRE